jgi:ABC-type sugar transport system ATPase subunit
VNTTDAVDGARPASADRAPLGAPEAQGGAGEADGLILRLRGIGKSFGSVKALTDIDLDLPAGKVTALVGDNGAGKSTLIKAISGISAPDAGQFIWQGSPVHIRTPADAAELGIATVYQDLALCDNLDIVQNMFLGHELLRSRLLDEAAMELGAKAALNELSVVTVRSIRQTVGSLSGGQRQAVAVAKAVMSNAKLVILDEPTAALGVSQTAMVLDLIRQLASRGVAVLVVSHNLTDMFAVADNVAVLYLGRIAGTGAASDLDAQTVVELITTGTTSRAASAAAPIAAGGTDLPDAEG